MDKPLFPLQQKEKNETWTRLFYFERPVISQRQCVLCASNIGSSECV